MKTAIMNFSGDMLTRQQMKSVIGGLLTVGSATANCLDGTTRVCKGTSCYSQNETATTRGQCQCTTPDGADDAATCD